MNATTSHSENVKSPLRNFPHLRLEPISLLRKHSQRNDEKAKTCCASFWRNEEEIELTKLYGIKKKFDLFSNLKITKEGNLEELKGVYFHEDLFRQVEFIPRENINFIENENNKICKFS